MKKSQKWGVLCLALFSGVLVYRLPMYDATPSSTKAVAWKQGEVSRNGKLELSLFANFGQHQLIIPKKFVSYSSARSKFAGLDVYWPSLDSVRARTVDKLSFKDTVGIYINEAHSHAPTPRTEFVKWWGDPVASSISSDLLEFPSNWTRPPDASQYYFLVNVALESLDLEPIFITCNGSGICRSFVHDLPGLRIYITFYRSRLPDAGELHTDILNLVMSFYVNGDAKG